MNTTNSHNAMQEAKIIDTVGPCNNVSSTEYEKDSELLTQEAVDNKGNSHCEARTKGLMSPQMQNYKHTSSKEKSSKRRS
eukprot:9968849-Ditylum_brightwellii.AAC.1